MSKTDIITIEVEKVGKYGPKAVGHENYFGLSYPLKEFKFSIGAKYDVRVEPWSSNGKSGLNIMEVLSEHPQVSNGRPQTNGKKPEVDWAAKDRSQLVGGRSHDAVCLAQLSFQLELPLDTILKRYEEALQGILEIADRVK